MNATRVEVYILYFVLALSFIYLIDKTNNIKKENQQLIDTAIAEYAVYDTTKIFLVNRQDWSVLKAQVQTHAAWIRPRVGRKKTYDIHLGQQMDKQRRYWEKKK